MKSNTQITMSLNQILEFHPCERSLKTLLKAQGGVNADYDKQIPLSDILKSNGIRDAIWCMRVNWFEHKELYMRFVNDCVKRAKEYANHAAYAAYADAAYAAAAAAYAEAAAYAAAEAIERKTQYDSLLALLTNN